MLGKGKRGLAKQRKSHQKLRTFREIISADILTDAAEDIMGEYSRIINCGGKNVGGYTLE